MATNLYFVPARTKGKENAVLNGFCYFLDRSRDDRSYWKCCCYNTHSWKFLDCLKSEQDLTDLKMARRLM